MPQRGRELGLTKNAAAAQQWCPVVVVEDRAGLGGAGQYIGAQAELALAHHAHGNPCSAT